MQEENNNAGVAPEAAPEADAFETMDVAALLEQLAAERDRLEADKAALSDMLLRRSAEFDNYRKRTERERSDLIEYAASDAVKAMLPVLDDLERALAQAPAGEEFTRGVELIYQRMVDALGKLGLEAIVAEGQPFDPNLHHAIEMVPCEEGEDHTVIGDLLRGYKFKGRLLRPSMVRVAVRQ
ncbi:MAG TPA: nucleotide exchange factor GrpE [Bryobacteraceae bacterium]|nr:nucleotide exchange factor GrpE [Bryobacteraceae bacterium]HPT24981.1 nucleotide exchange factor GrpE [Bryobacteraceae bacterium]